MSRKEGGKAPEGYVLLEGELDAEARAVYIACKDAVYEAFLLHSGSFGAYIPVDAVVSGVYCDIP